VIGNLGRVGERVGQIGVSFGFSIWQPHRRIKRVTVTTKITAQTKSLVVGADDGGLSRSTCLVIEAVMSWFTLSKM